MAAQKKFHKIFTFEQARRFFQVLLSALLISDYARASFFAQRNRVTFDEAVRIFLKRIRATVGGGFAIESRES
jgi:hypothetical protein